MEFDHIELKRQARERMALTDPKFWVVALAYLVTDFLYVVVDPRISLK